MVDTEVELICYSEDYRDQISVLIADLQDHIISIDSFDRVRRDNALANEKIKKLESKINSGKAQAFLAVKDKIVLGISVGVILTRDKDYDMEVKPGLYGEIETLYVKPEFRGQGIGKKLFDLTESYLKKGQNCDFIEITVFGDNKEALTAYKKNGYREREYKLLKNVNSS